MSKPRPNLAMVFDDLDRPAPPDAPAIQSLVLVGANIDPMYARGVALVHAKTGLTKKQIVTQALDMLFAAHGITPRTLENL
jgi:hypothetical protein